MKRLSSPLLCGFVVASLAAAGCTRAQARVVPEPPPLDVPAPPPRHVETIEAELPPPEPAVPEPEPQAPARPRASTPVQQRDAARPEPPKVDVSPPAEQTTRPADELKGQPQTTLQTTPAGREAQLERTIQDMLVRANANLNRVDYGRLNADARTQYDQAKRFISQAQDALRAKNLVFAENLADKANTLAGQLSGR
jgi:hypothetical protein